MKTDYTPEEIAEFGFRLKQFVQSASRNNEKIASGISDLRLAKGSLDRARLQLETIERALSDDSLFEVFDKLHANLVDADYSITLAIDKINK